MSMKTGKPQQMIMQGALIQLFGLTDLQTGQGFVLVIVCWQIDVYSV